MLSDAMVARRNFACLTLNQIFLRIGWIFRTESVLIPAFLDSLGAASWQRGLLPTVGRLGQSLPQLFAAAWLGHRPTYRRHAITATVLLAIPWAALAALLNRGLPTTTMLWLFLFLYTFSWFAFGVYSLLIGTLQGKLIAIRERGKLLAVSNATGCVLSTVAAGLLLPRWISQGNAGYTLIFLTAAIGFVAAALALAPAIEHASEFEPRTESFWAQSTALVRGDANVRRLMAVVTLSYVSLLLFPHYEKFGSTLLGVSPNNRVNMVIIQNLMNALASALVGPFSDRRGNRLSLSIVTATLGLAPLAAVLFTLVPDFGRHWYWLVFGLLGFNPVTGRVLTNYVLEVAPESEHPLYLGTINAVHAAPIIFAPLVGWLIDLTSFQFVFIVFAVIMFAGAVLSLTLVEPRQTNPL